MSRSTNKRPIITHLNPKSPISEAYRTLRTNLQFSMVDEPLKTLMVTSTGPGEGKSTTVANLAVTYAQAGQQVLVLDCDLRKPTMHHTFFVSNQRGLTNLLSGQCAITDVCHTTQIDNLFVLPSGPIPPNPAEMLLSKKMTALLEQLKPSFDIIIVDTPPAIAVTDAQIVSTRCDGCIIVIEAGKVKKEMALRAKASLEQVNARLLGVVLNNVDRKHSDAYSYYYYYYGKDQG
jgi:capsular exopolysaccharide synthesis family protein